MMMKLSTSLNFILIIIILSLTTITVVVVALNDGPLDPVPPQPIPSNLKGPALIFDEMTIESLDWIVNELNNQYNAGMIPFSTPILIGSYGISSNFSHTIESLRQLQPDSNIHYAPTFSLVRKNEPYWNGRQPVNGTIWPGPGPAGVIPAWQNISTVDEKYVYAVELGQRMRDEIEQAKCCASHDDDDDNDSTAIRGMNITSFVLDEVSGSAYKPIVGDGICAVFKGISVGLAFGRVGRDEFMSGVTYFANIAALLHRDRQPASLTSLWQALNATMNKLIIEEYPVFNILTISEVTDRFNNDSISLSALGPVGRSLSKRIISGVTIGYQGPGPLNGLWNGTQLLPLSPQQLSQYRATYFQQRSKYAVGGFGQYAFIGKNNHQHIVERATADLALAANKYFTPHQQPEDELIMQQ